MCIKTITIIGLSLQFVAFWLAAPEILGAEWLKKTERILRKTIAMLPSVFMFTCGIVLGLLTGDFSFKLWDMLLVLPLMIVVLVYYKKIGVVLDRWIATPLLNRLILQDNFRFLLLKIAAIAFSLGFFMQIIAIAWS